MQYEGLLSPQAVILRLGLFWGRKITFYLQLLEIVRPWEDAFALQDEEGKSHQS